MAPKYRHRGYRDNDNEERERSRPPQRKDLSFEEKIQRRSMRKATNREANEVVRCHVCGNNVEQFGPIEACSVCPKCSAPVHCCRACAHFDTSVRWQCRAKISAPVNDKNKANQCAQFQARLVLDFTGRRETPRANGSNGSNDPRSQFEDLFKR